MRAWTLIVTMALVGCGGGKDTGTTATTGTAATNTGTAGTTGTTTFPDNVSACEAYIATYNSLVCVQPYTKDPAVECPASLANELDCVNDFYVCLEADIACDGNNIDISGYYDCDSICPWDDWH